MKCPFTQEDVNKIDPLKLAITYNLEQEVPRCGHESCLLNLVSHLCSGNSVSKMKNCPCCCLKITDIYDGMANDFVFSKNENKEVHDLISFKYAAHNFHLFISPNNANALQLNQMPQTFGNYMSKRFRQESSSCLAQDRIAAVLDIDKKNMKILFKGKVIFPIKDSLSVSPEDLSQKMVEISIKDLGPMSSRKKNNPSLVVMGTPRRKLAESQRFVGAGHLRHQNTWTGKFSHFIYLGMFSFISLLKTVAGATILLIKTFFVPGGQIDGDQSS